MRLSYYIDPEDNLESRHFDEGKKTDKNKNSKSLLKTICIIFGSLMTLTLSFMIYLGLYTVLTNMTRPVRTVTVSSEGPAAEMYPDYMGQYNLVKEVVRYDRAVYKHVYRDDRFIICAGNIENKIQSKRSD